MTAADFANLAGVGESETLAMTRRAAALRDGGRAVLSLSAGEPDFPTPAYIAEAGIRAIRDGHTYYPPAAGLSPLREAIAAWVGERLGGRVEPSRVLVSAGAKQALFEAIFVLFEPGDRVVVPAPYWVSYPPMVRLARAEPFVLTTRPEDGFLPRPDELAEALGKGARGVVLNSPSNPTGAMLDPETLGELLDVAAEHDAWVVADEIYHAIRYAEPFASVAPRLADDARIVLVDGFSKAFSMTGWRVGYAVAPAAVHGAMTLLQGHLNTNTALPCQHAALAALVEADERERAIGAMVEAFARRRNRLLEGLAGVPGLVAHPPDGAFYLWIDAEAWCDRLGGGSSELCLDLLEHERVALVPGSAFGSEGFVRISFAAADEVLEEAVVRLAEAAERLSVA